MANKTKNLGLDVLEGGSATRKPSPQSGGRASGNYRVTLHDGRRLYTDIPPTGARQVEYLGSNSQPARRQSGSALPHGASSVNSGKVFRIVRPDGSVEYRDISDGPGQVEMVAGYRERPAHLRYRDTRPLDAPAVSVNDNYVMARQYPKIMSSDNFLPVNQERAPEEYDDLFSKKALGDFLGYLAVEEPARVGAGAAMLLGDMVAPDVDAPIDKYRDADGFAGQVNNHRQIFGRGLAEFGREVIDGAMRDLAPVKTILNEQNQKIMNYAKGISSGVFSGGISGGLFNEYGKQRYERGVSPREAFDRASEEALVNLILTQAGKKIISPVTRKMPKNNTTKLVKDSGGNAFREVVKREILKNEE